MTLKCLGTSIIIGLKCLIVMGQSKDKPKMALKSSRQTEYVVSQHSAG